MHQKMRLNQLIEKVRRNIIQIDAKKKGQKKGSTKYKKPMMC